MATLDIAQAAMTIGRPPETIEQWILAGRVEAERDGTGWAIDMRSLLNAATADDAAKGGNGGSADHGARSPLQQPDDLGGRRAPSHEATTSVAIAEPPAPASPPEQPAAPEPGFNSDLAAPASGSDPHLAASVPPSADSRLANVTAAEAAGPAHHSSEPTVEIASAAISALSARLEQAMSEIDRLHDERLKLALQLGYAQAQLKASAEQLRALSAPPDPDPLTRLLRWLLRRGPRSESGA